VIPIVSIMGKSDIGRTIQRGSGVGGHGVAYRT